MKKASLTVRVDEATAQRLAAISVAEGRSQGDLVRRALRSQYGIEPPGQALARALGNRDALWASGGRGEHD
jgi:predicted transcriptional regulator